MKYIPVIFCCIFLSACQKLPDPVCSGIALIGNSETSVQIYGVRTIANQTQYKAGYPFNWQWVGKNNFTRTTCEK